MKIDPDILNELIENRSDSRKKAIISLLKSQSDKEAFQETKQIIRRYEFSHNRKIFDFSKIGLEVKDVAYEIAGAFKDKTYNDVYAMIYGCHKRGFKPENRNDELIKIISKTYAIQENEFVFDYK